MVFQLQSKLDIKRLQSGLHMSKGRRFGFHEVKKGAFEGSLHFSKARYTLFLGQLSYLHTYLTRRLLPAEPEDVTMQGILIILQNLLEHEAEEAIRQYSTAKGTTKEQEFYQKIENGYVSFKGKCDWLLARDLITQADWEIMDEVRRLRNQYAHSRPRTTRQRYHYRKFQLLTNRSVRQLFVDVELILRKLRMQSNRSSDWMTIPPGYPAEMGWPIEQIEALTGSGSH